MSDRILDRRTYERGRPIFKEGDPGDAAFMLETGQVAIIKKLEEGNKRLATLRSGSIFGEMAIIDGSPRMASAVPISSVTVIRIPADEFKSKMAVADPLLRALLNIFTNSLRNIQLSHVAKPRNMTEAANHIHLVTVTLAALAARSDNTEIQTDIMDVVEQLKIGMKDVLRISQI